MKNEFEVFQFVKIYLNKELGEKKNLGIYRRGRIKGISRCFQTAWMRREHNGFCEGH